MVKEKKEGPKKGNKGIDLKLVLLSSVVARILSE